MTPIQKDERRSYAEAAQHMGVCWRGLNKAEAGPPLLGFTQ